MKKVLFTLGYYVLIAYLIVLNNYYWFMYGKNGYPFNNNGLELIFFGIIIVCLFLARNQVKTQYFEKSVSLWISGLLSIPVLIFITAFLLEGGNVTFDLMGTIMIGTLTLLSINFLVGSFIKDKY